MSYVTAGTYVGELIMSLREAAPDLPIQVYPPPPAPASLAGITNTNGALTPGVTYYFTCTLVFPWGETLPSPEVSFTLPAGSNGIILGMGGQQPGMLGYRVYVATSPGQETVWEFLEVTFPNAFPVPLFFVTFLGYPLYPGQAPTRNSAYVPDTDGRMLSAFRVFGWLNDALGIAGQITGGLPNFTGINVIAGQPWYDLRGNWKKLDGAWYNGYPIFFGRRTDVFRKNSVTGISAALCVDQYTDRIVVELWPQPSTSGAITSITQGIGPSDTSVPIASSIGFQTTFGFAQINSGYNVEIVSVQNWGMNVMQGLGRGWGGTRAQTWSAGTIVKELNLCVSGLVIPSSYNPGDSTSVLFLPPGWSSGLHKYMLSRFREAERRRQEAKSLMDEFTATMQNLRTTRQYAGPIQIQANTGRGSEVYPGLGGPFGGVIVP